MVKNNILEDSFEKLVEQGATQTKKAVKSAVKQVTSTFSPTKMWEQILGTSTETSKVEEGVYPEQSRGRKTAEVGKGKKHTPLDLEKLGKNYKDAEAQKTEALRQRLFQLVKRGEEKVLLEKKQEEEEKKQKEAYEVQEKRKKKEEENQKRSGDLPHGKIRRSIFSHKKIAQRQHTETKPSTGKQ